MRPGMQPGVPGLGREAGRRAPGWAFWREPRTCCHENRSHQRKAEVRAHGVETHHDQPAAERGRVAEAAWWMEGPAGAPANAQSEGASALGCIAWGTYRCADASGLPHPATPPPQPAARLSHPQHARPQAAAGRAALGGGWAARRRALDVAAPHAVSCLRSPGRDVQPRDGVRGPGARVLLLMDAQCCMHVPAARRAPCPPLVVRGQTGQRSRSPERHHDDDHNALPPYVHLRERQQLPEVSRRCLAPHGAAWCGAAL